MSGEIADIAFFLQAHPPFNALPTEALEYLARRIEVSYRKAGSNILHYGETIDDLYIVRSGAVELFRRNGELYNRMAEGAIFGQMGLMMNRKVRFPAKALEDSLLYCLPADDYDDYCDKYEAFADYFEAEQEGVLRHALEKELESSDLSTVKIRSCMRPSPIRINASVSVQQAAQLMTEHQIAALLVTDDTNGTDSSDVSLLGILTDSDLRSRVLAKALSANTPVHEVMTPEPITLDTERYLFEAMLTMLRENVHHLPVVSRGELRGIISMADILQHESQNSLIYVREIFNQLTLEGLAQHAQRLPAVFQRMVNEDANSKMIGSAMSVIGRSFCQRLLSMAEEKLGAPPVPYCFICLGSMAREEQTLVTDQDNALILHDDFDATLHGEYFERLSEYVCQALDQCGYPLCTGDIMAQNPQWRMTLSDWKQQFKDWLEKPEPRALLNSNIFFDLEGIDGEIKLAQDLRKFVAAEAPRHPRFIACMAHNALNRTPPLGFFKEFVVEPDGAYRNTINLKRRGTAPLGDLVRVHALALGSQARNSFERIDDIDAAGILPEDKARELADAMEYLSMVRVQHQAKAIDTGQAPDNQVDPKSLSAFERRSLKAAFQVLDNAQKFIKFRYTAKQAIR